MSITMYKASVPVCIHMLNNLIGILEKGAAYCEDKGIAESVLVHARLYPDMFPLTSQVQIASDIARRGGARLAGLEPEVYADTEISFHELIDRARSAITFLEGLAPEQIDGTEDKSITFKLRGEDVTFDGLTFLLHFVLPNVYFHVTTAYDILRHNGVELGKPDFLGKL